MDTKNILKSDYLDILFDGRNKAYGGYYLRKHYASRARKAGVGVLLAMVLVSSGFYIANAIKPTHDITLVDHGPIILHPLVDPPPVPPPPPPPPPAPPAPTIAFPPPVIAEDEAVQDNERPAEVSELQNAMPGSHTHDGEPTGMAPNIMEGNTGGTGIVEPPEAPKIFTTVAQMPEFPGNVMGYLAQHTQYPPQARETGQEGRVVVRFVVDEEGAVTNVEVMKGPGGQLDREAIRVVSSMPRWKPGRHNGRAVKVYFTLPITFRLQ